ncbi:MAG: PQQ-binding-like beta-propeller repeat protein [Phycisphaerales bacterium]|nr:PQQ-binding-like beta-propeller repeat protein [Hyphomonadaceae bacterium]
MKQLAPLFVLLAACSQTAAPPPSAQQVSLELMWRATGLANPESAALSADGAFLYVTNVNGEADARDGNGFIARVSTDGRVLQREFATGLDGPKGVMLGGDALYVADINQLVVLDAATGAVRRRVPTPGAQFLNDLTFSPDGQVLIADSGAGRIYAIRTDTPEIWLEHPLLASINGFLPEPERLVVTTMQGRLLAIDYQTKAIRVLAEGLGDADGLAALGGGRYIVSEWPGRMHVVAADGSHATILETAAETRYLNDFLLVDDVLYQPHWEPSEFSAYRVSGLAAN